MPDPIIEPSFLEFIQQSRNEFVKRFLELNPDARQRVIAENLLICFDQMHELLKALT